jgi:hypothetical protein
MDYQDGFPVPALIGWPKEAEDVWDARIAKHDQEYDEEEGAMKGVWAKLDQYAGRFVVILAALRQASAKSFNPKTIPVATPEEVERAWKLVNYFKAMARRVEHQVSSGGLDTDALRVLGWIQTRRHIKEFSTADITYSIREYGKRKAALLMVMEQLERLCVVRKLPQPTREKTGRPPDPRYAVNPKLRKKKPIE